MWIVALQLTGIGAAVEHKSISSHWSEYVVSAAQLAVGHFQLVYLCSLCVGELGLGLVLLSFAEGCSATSVES